MDWTCEMLEDTMNYIRVELNGKRLFMLDIETDTVGFWTDNDTTKVRHLSKIYKEMIDKQKLL